MRSSLVSPMPIRMPLVKGTRACPARRIVSIRAAGTLLGEPKCGPPLRQRCSDALSSMIPCDTLTPRSKAMSSADIVPGLTCGRRPESWDAAASGSEVAKRRIKGEPREILARGLVPQLRLVAQGEQCLAATGRRANARDRQHLLLVQIGLPLDIGELREGAIMTDVPAKLGQRNEDFA